MSGDLAAPVWRADAASLPRTVHLNEPFVNETEHDGDNWYQSLLAMLLERLKARLSILDAEGDHLQHLLSEQTGPTVVLLMSYEDAWDLFSYL